MKRTYKSALAVVLGFLMFAAGCSNLLNSPAEKAFPPDITDVKDGEGAVRISFGQEQGRTVMPGTMGLYYALAFVQEDGAGTQNVYIAGEESKTVNLAIGQWTLTVKGYISQAAFDADTEENSYGLYGQETGIGISAGQTTAVSLSLVAVEQTEGQIAFNLTFPPAVSAGTIDFTPLVIPEGVSAPAQVNLFTLPGYDGTQGAVLHSITVPSGYYRLILKLRLDDTKMLVRPIVVQVKDNLETPVSGTYTAGDFAPYFSTLAAMTEYLTDLPDNTLQAPYRVALAVDFNNDIAEMKNTNFTNFKAWSKLAAALVAGKYVDLDLSACTGTIVGVTAPLTTDVNAKYTLVAGITLPNHLSSLPNNALFFPNLKELTLPEGITSVDRNAFNNCTNLETISLPSTLKILPTVSNTPFVQGSLLNLKKIIIPASLSVDLGAYFIHILLRNSENSSKSLEFEARGYAGGVGYRVIASEDPEAAGLGDGTLVRVDEAGKLTVICAPNPPAVVVISPAVKAVSNSAFSYSNHITGFDGSSAVSLESMGYQNYGSSNSLAEVDLSGSVITEWPLFSSTKGVKTIKLPGTLTTAVSGGAQTWKSLESLVFPEDLSAAAFPTGVAFGDFDDIATFKLTITPGTTGAVNYSTACNGTILLSGDGSKLIAALDWVSETVSGALPSGITEIASYAFYSKSKAVSVVLPATVTVLGASAFYGTPALETLDMSACAGLTTMTGAFSLSSLKILKLPPNTTNVPSPSFASCAGLEEVYLDANMPADITNTTFSSNAVNLTFYISGGAGAYTTGGKVLVKNGELAWIAAAGTVTIPALVSSIPDAFFKGKTAITALDLSQATGLASIGAESFSGCTALTALDLSGLTALETIGDSAFYGCNKVVSINFGASSTLTSIGASAFYNCTALTALDLSGLTALETIGANAFYSCSNLTWVKWPQSGAGASLGTQTFRSCAKLVKVQLPDDLVSIGNNAFQSCSVITTYVFESAAPPVMTTAAGTLTGVTAYAIYVPNANVGDYTTTNSTEGWTDARKAKVVAVSTLTDPPSGW
jgi:hypothetical protein